MVELHSENRALDLIVSTSTYNQFVNFCFSGLNLVKQKLSVKKMKVKQIKNKVLKIPYSKNKSKAKKV